MIDPEKYEILIVSDLERDGMCLEIHKLHKPINPILEIFFSDITKTFAVSLFEENVEVELIEEAIKIAKWRLPPDPNL